MPPDPNPDSSSAEQPPFPPASPKPTNLGFNKYQIAATLAAVCSAIAAGGSLWTTYLQKGIAHDNARAWLAPTGPITHILPKRNEVHVGIKNYGNTPAIHVIEELRAFALPKADWNNPIPMLATIRQHLGVNGCANLSPKRDGLTIWPRQTGAGILLSFTAEDNAKVDAKTHFLAVTGCLVYETLETRHETEVCLILDDDGHTDSCIVFQGTT